MLRRGFIDLDNYSKVLVSGRGSCFTRKQRKNCLRHGGYAYELKC